jgi:APA family basic amino acid/polyamine antiporter
VNIGTLSAFIFLAISVIVLRRTQLDIKRRFKCPLVPIVPILSIISCLFLITQLSSTTLQRFAISLIIGVSVYFLYGMHKSKLNNNDDDDDDDDDLNRVNLIATDKLIETKLE